MRFSGGISFNVFCILRNSTDDNYLGLFIPSSSSTHRVRIAYRPTSDRLIIIHLLSLHKPNGTKSLNVMLVKLVVHRVTFSFPGKTEKKNSIYISSFNKIGYASRLMRPYLIQCTELSAAESAAVPAYQTKKGIKKNSDEWHPDLGIETGKTCCSK